MKIFKEGDEISTIGRFGSKCANIRSGGVHFSLPIWARKVYVAKRNYKGELKWFFKECIGRTIASREPSNRFTQEVMSACGDNYLEGIVHLKKINNRIDI